MAGLAVSAGASFPSLKNWPSASDKAGSHSSSSSFDNFVASLGATEALFCATGFLMESCLGALPVEEARAADFAVAVIAGWAAAVAVLLHVTVGPLPRGWESDDFSPILASAAAAGVTLLSSLDAELKLRKHQKRYDTKAFQPLSVQRLPTPNQFLKSSPDRMNLDLTQGHSQSDRQSWPGGCIKHVFGRQVNTKQMWFVSRKIEAGMTCLLKKWKSAE